jgi:hypothetical protein
MSNYRCNIVLGEKYRDIITGFEGVATSLTFRLHGCERVQLTAMVDKKPGDYWFEAPGLRRVDNDLEVGFSTNRAGIREAENV